MKKLLSGVVFSGAMFAVSAAPALAWFRPGNGHGRRQLHSVPEIDASAGLLAIAAVLVILAFVWERNRRLA